MDRWAFRTNHKARQRAIKLSATSNPQVCLMTKQGNLQSPKLFIWHIKNKKLNSLDTHPPAENG